jgi:hypothetical protein
MPFRWLSCLLLTSIAFGQAAPPAPSASGEARIERSASIAADQTELNDAYVGPATPAPAQGGKPANQATIDPNYPN